MATKKITTIFTETCVCNNCVLTVSEAVDEKGRKVMRFEIQSKLPNGKIVQELGINMNPGKSMDTLIKAIKNNRKTPTTK